MYFVEPLHEQFTNSIILTNWVCLMKVYLVNRNNKIRKFSVKLKSLVRKQRNPEFKNDLAKKS